MMDECKFFDDPADLTDEELQGVMDAIDRHIADAYIRGAVCTPHSSHEKWAQDGITEMRQYWDELDREAERRRVDDYSAEADWVYELEKDRRIDDLT